MSKELLDHDNFIKWFKWSQKVLKSKRSKRMLVLLLLLVLATAALYCYVQWQATRPYKEELSKLQADNSRLLALLKDGELAKEQLKVAQSKLESIQRRFGNSEFFDIKKLSVHKSDVKLLPSNAHYFEGEFFYAPTNSPEWRYSREEPTNYLKFITGEEVTGDEQRMLANTSLHVWRKECIHSVTHSSLVSNLVTCVCVAKLGIDDLKDVMGLDVNTIKVVDYKAVFAGDVVGVMLATELNSLFVNTSVVADIRADLVTVQKLENVLYSQSRFALKNAEIDGRKFKEYYVYLDEMIVSLPPSIYVVIAIVPTPEPAPRGADFNSINEWYTQLAILADP